MHKKKYSFHVKRLDFSASGGAKLINHQLLWVTSMLPNLGLDRPEHLKSSLITSLILFVTLMGVEQHSINKHYCAGTTSVY